MNREQLLAAMSAMIAAAEAESRDFTADEAAKYEELEAQLAAFDANASRRARVQAARDSAPRRPNPAPAPEPAAAGTPIPRPAGDSAPTTFDHAGEFLAAVFTNPRDARLQYNPEAGARIAAEQRMDTGAVGGFMVPEQFRSDIMQVQPATSLIRPRAMVIPAGSPPDAKITLPALDQGATSNMYGGVEISFVEGEGGTKPDTSGKLRLVSFEPKEYAAVMTFTDKLLRNWTAAGSFFVAQMRGAVAAFEDTKFLSGNGVAEPTGVLNSAAAYSVTRDTSSDFTFNDVVSMIARLRSTEGAVWSISRSVLPKVYAMRNLTGVSPEVGGGELIFVPSAVPGAPDTLMGIPIFWNERAPALGSKGDVALLNLSQYIIKDGSGLFVASDGGIVNFTTNKTLVKVFGNVDGGPWLTAPIKLEGGYEVSPFVVLAA